MGAMPVDGHLDGTRMALRKPKMASIWLTVKTITMNIMSAVTS